jgi:uncharacterized phosphosugar-binding protein
MTTDVRPREASALHSDALADRFATAALSLLGSVAQDREAVDAAADLLADCLGRDGVIQVFGTGHSQGTAMEFAGRAGGLIATNRISLADLAVFGDQPVEVLHDVLLERELGLAARLIDLIQPHPQDVFVIISNSGVNAAVVDMALEAKSRGHKVIALTSRASSAALPSRHESGTRLADHADVTLDNHAPEGDTALDLGDGLQVCGLSSLSGALVAQLVVAATIERLLARGEAVPAYRSANVPGGHERNQVLEAHYAGRLRRSAL